MKNKKTYDVKMILYKTNAAIMIQMHPKKILSLRVFLCCIISVSVRCVFIYPSCFTYLIVEYPKPLQMASTGTPSLQSGQFSVSKLA